jgi:hypothetical protein
MVLITKEHKVFNDVNGLFKKSATGLTKKNKTGKKIRKITIKRGGGESLWKRLMNKIKKVEPKNDTKDEIIYDIKRNNNDTGDVYTIIKNGTVINTKELNDDKFNNVFKMAYDNLKSFLIRFNKKSPKTDDIKGGEVGDYLDAINAITGGEMMYFPDKVNVDENTNFYKKVYKKRNTLGIVGTVFLNLFFLFVFWFLYVIFFVAYSASKHEVPFDFYKKYIIVNGQEVRV